MRRVVSDVWDDRILDMWMAAGIRRPVNIYKTTRGVASWFEGTSLHSEKGVAGCVVAKSTGARYTTAEWIRPYTRRGGGPSFTQRVEDQVVQDGPTGQQRINLPGGNLLYHVRVSNDGAERLK
jgi:hypothetical protein